MRKLTVIFIFLSAFAFGQVTPVLNVRIPSNTYTFGINIAVGWTVFDIAAGKKYTCISSALSSENLTTASAKFIEMPFGSFSAKQDSTKNPFMFSGGYIIPRITANIGIGTTSSIVKFNVSSTLSYAGLFTNSGTNSANSGVTGQATGAGTTNTGISGLAANGTNNHAIETVPNYPGAGAGNYSIYSASQAQSYFSGSVGIGVSQPSTALDVSGIITATGGNSTNWNGAYSHSQASHQTIINGTGFVKASGTTLSYDNSSYEPANANIQNHISSVHANIVDEWYIPLSNGTDYTNSPIWIDRINKHLNIDDPTEFNSTAVFRDTARFEGYIRANSRLYIGYSYYFPAFDTSNYSTAPKRGWYLTLPAGKPPYPTSLVWAQPVVYFGGGVDSSLIKTSVKFPLGYSQGMVIDTLVYIPFCSGSNVVDLVPSMKYGTDMSQTGTATISSPAAVTDENTPTKRTSFDNGRIPAGNIVWLEFTTVTTRPKSFMVQLITHRD